MFTVDLHGKTYEVTFQHYYEGTDCFIVEIEGGVPKGERVSREQVRGWMDESRLNPKDQFCRATGRRVSLGHCLQSAGIDKGDRFMFWLGYFKTAGEKEADPFFSQTGIGGL